MGCTLTKDIVVIDDNYTVQLKQNYLIAGEKMNEVVAEYVRILKGVVDESGLSGKTAQKLGQFADLAESLLKDTMLNWSEQLTSRMVQYVTEIDTADKEIY